MFRTIFRIGLFVLLGSPAAFAQQRLLDSLVRMEQNYRTEDTIRAKLLADIARNLYFVDPSKGVEYAEKAISLAEKLPEKKFLALAYSAKGTNKLGLADYPDALENYQKALAINEKIGNQQGIGNNYNNIGLVYYSIFNYPRALEFYQKNLKINERLGNKTAMVNSLGNIGNVYNELHDYPKAIEYYERALALSESAGNTQSVAGLLVNIGNVYTQLPDYTKALEYKQRALQLNRQLGRRQLIANNLGNIGNVYTKLGDYPLAIQYHREALELLEQTDDKKGIAFNLSSLGQVYYLQNDYPLAVQYVEKARTIARSVGALNTESETLATLSKIYEAKGRYDSAYAAYKLHIELRDSINNVEKQTDVTKKTLQYEFSKTEDSLKQQKLLAEAQLNEQLLLAAQQKQQLILQQNAVDLAQKQKELQRLAFLKSQADLQFEQSQNKIKAEQLVLAENEKQLQQTQVNLQQAQLQLQDKELQSQKVQRIIYLLGIGLLALLSFFIFRNYQNQRRSNILISQEKQKSDDLLHNILPEEVALELREKGEAPAKLFNEVTVLFTDFVDFTRFSENLSPQELVRELHACFKAFDDIMERYGMEKIKTIGDAYMAVSGLPVTDPQHARKAALAAFDIRQFMFDRREAGLPTFEVRIGLHSGPVVAGIVGVKKFAYDIWGDTVNTAARMESSSEPGRINISGSTCALLKNDFQCLHRGKIAAKNKGDIDMYFLEK